MKNRILRKSKWQKFESGSDSIISGSEYGQKLMVLAQKIETEQQQRLRDRDLACQPNLDNAVTCIRLGKKYDKIDVGRSGKLMIVRATGEIFGVKGYGKIHKGHIYGTLDTVDEWYWGCYYPQPAKPVMKAVLFKKDTVSVYRQESIQT